MKSFLPTAVVLVPLFAAATLPAQVALVLNRDGGSGLHPAIGAHLPGPIYPSGFGLVNEFERPSLPNFYAGSIAGTGTPTPPVANEGDIAVDQDARLVYTTDGLSFLAQDAHSLYGTVPTAPTASLPLTGWPGGALTGLAISSAGLLFICDGTLCQARSKFFPYAAATPPFVMPPFLGAPGATGLDYESATGTLWACNADGATVHFTTTGALLEAFPAPPVPGLSPVRGIAVNPMAGPLAMPPILPQTPGFHVCLTNGSILCDAMAPYGTISLLGGFGSYCRGMAITADPVLLPGQWVAGSPGFHRYNNDPALNPGPGFLYPQIGLTRPTVAFATGPSHLTLDGAAASTGVLFLAGVYPLDPTGGGVIVGPDVLWTSPFAPFYLIGGATTDGAGHSEVDIPIGLLPIGFHMVTQWLVPDASAYLSYDFSDALVFRVGLN